MEKHLKRFFIEVYHDSSMYEDYLKGSISLNKECYQEWCSKMDKRNYLFAKSLKDIHRPYPKDFVIESALSDNLTVSKYLHNKGEITVSEFGFSKLQITFLNPTKQEKKLHYICNGCFIDTLENIERVLERGSFSVGICCEKNTDLYKEIVNYYNQLKDNLLNAGYRVASFQSHCTSNERIYLLRYDSITGKVKK